MTDRLLFKTMAEAQAAASVMPGHKAVSYDPTLHCDYACLRAGCRGGCDGYEVVKDEPSRLVAVATTVPLCGGCQGTRKVRIERGNLVPVTVPCGCVIDTLEACEARINGLEKMVLDLNGIRFKGSGVPYLGDRDR